MNKARLVIFDGNETTRSLLKCVFEDSPGIEVVGEAADHQSAIALVRQFAPDAVIIGYDLPSAEEFELRSLLRSGFLQTRIIELSELDKSVSKKLSAQPVLKYHQSAMVH